MFFHIKLHHLCKTVSLLITTFSIATESLMQKPAQKTLFINEQTGIVLVVCGHEG